MWWREPPTITMNHRYAKPNAADEFTLQDLLPWFAMRMQRMVQR